MKKCFRFKNIKFLGFFHNINFFTSLHLFCTSYTFPKQYKNSYSNKHRWRPGRYFLSPANLLTLTTYRPCFKEFKILYFLKYLFHLFQKPELLHIQSSGKPDSLSEPCDLYVCLFFLIEIASRERSVQLVCYPSGVRLIHMINNWWHPCTYFNATSKRKRWQAERKQPLSFRSFICQSHLVNNRLKSQSGFTAVLLTGDTCLQGYRCNCMKKHYLEEREVDRDRLNSGSYPGRDEDCIGDACRAQGFTQLPDAVQRNAVTHSCVVPHSRKPTQLPC